MLVYHGNPFWVAVGLFSNTRMVAKSNSKTSLTFFSVYNQGINVA